MTIRSWLRNALRPFTARRAYVGRHVRVGGPWSHQIGLPGQTIIEPWTQRGYANGIADLQWGEALHAMARRRRSAVLAPA